MVVILLFTHIQSTMDDSLDSPSESQFYEHLTELIRLFKSILLAFNDTLVLMRADDDYDHAVLKLRKILAEELELGQRYDLSLQPHQHLHSAFQRFVCRLLENLAPAKAKGAKEDRPVPLAEEYVLRIENCINFHRRQKNVGKLFRRIFVYTQKFCEGCEMLLSCCSHSEAVEGLRREAEEERESSEESKQQPRPSPPSQTQSESPFHKIMLVYNKRFSTIGCLDLDYNSYKTYCYMSRSDPDGELFKDFANRNAIVSRAIARYSKHFTDYLRRKEKTLLKKNRFRELKEIKVNEQTESECRCPSSRQKEDKKQKAILEPKTEESPTRCLPSLEAERKRNVQPEHSHREDFNRSTRGNYKLKSIYLTISKGHDKFEAMHVSNRFMFNYSLPRPQDTTKKQSTLKVNEATLKSAKHIVNDPAAASMLMQFDRNQGFEPFMYEQMLYHSKMAPSPRTSIIHNSHHQKKSEKRNIRITNLTFRGPNYSKISNIIDPENPTIS